MGRGFTVVAATALLGGCVALTGVGDLEAIDVEDAGHAGAEAGTLTDGAPGAVDANGGGDDDDVIVGPLDARSDAPVMEAGPDSSSTCVCTGLVSAYRFGDPNALGRDALDHNNMTLAKGMPTQSDKVPPGMAGSSLHLDGASNLCIAKPFTFDASKDHTVCWWSQPETLGSGTNQFAQTCTYDTWTSGDGVAYVWRINNCNGGTPEEYAVPGVYTVGTWVQICQTYEAATLKHAIVIDGKIAKKTVGTGTIPISADPDHTWCIGAYDTGAYWKGLIYLPMWWSRILSDSELANIAAKTCCLPSP